MRRKKECLQQFSLADFVLSLKRWLDLSGLYLSAKLKNSCGFKQFSPFIVLQHSVSDDKVLLFSNVGHLSRFNRSSYDISFAVVPSANLEARLWTFSRVAMSFFRCGDHTGELYSRIGLTRLLYNLENRSGLFGPTIRLTKPRTLLALFAHLVACRLYDKLDVI